MRHHRPWIAIVIAIAAAASCTRRAHTRSDFGVANRTVFDRQAEASGSGTAQGLDSEEAATTNQRYRETLGRRGRESRNDPSSSVLIIQGDRRDANQKD